MITAQIARQYHFLIPQVYRYMDNKYIDDFFNTGRLRLSSFKIYQNYEDPEKGDKGEGWNIAIATSKKENHTMYAVVGVGSNAYSFCTSTIYSEELKQKFNCDGAFLIKDSQSFGLAISNRLNGFLEGLQGHCIYQAERSTKKEIESLSLDDMKIAPDKPEIDMNKMFSKINEANSIDSFFMKPIRFQYQSEYRFIWIVNGDTSEYYEVECKEAIQFCEKIQ
jgi:hypothetical protein